MLAPHHRLEFISCNPHNEIGADDAKAHAISVHEGQATEHFAFSKARYAFQEGAHSHGELFVICHRTSGQTK
jgi:hypothetical protein